MPAALHELLSRDHARLDALLTALLSSDGVLDADSYAEFRSGLLRHIGIEERILFPEIRKHGGDTELERQLHRDHAALAALLAPPPTRAEIEQIREILLQHNPLEEESGGLYERFEEMAGDALDELMNRVRAYPPVRLAPHTDTPLLRRSIEQLLREAEEGRRALKSRG
jgi:hemerythrin superfamily protein